MVVQLGVLKVFSEAHADLSGISGRKGDLVLDEILQKAFIDVGEGAVEAAAGSDAGESVTIEI
jgi:serine protease inhibitor